MTDLSDPRPTADQLRGIELLHILRHAVGYPRFYRNHYSIDVGVDAYNDCELLVGIGLMYRGVTINDGRGITFCVTHEGLQFLRACAAKEGFSV